MSNFKYRWDILDKELVKFFKNKGKTGIYEFSKIYNVSKGSAFWRIRKLGFRIKRIQLKMENSYNWKGGKYVTDKGYVRVYIGNGKYAREHRLVMEKKLGRKLLKNEDVHHIDETFEARSNNDPSNLELKTKIDHTKHHLKGNGYCISFNKGSVKPWRLRFRNNKDTAWISFGLYETKERALIVVEKLRKLKENVGVGK